MLFAFICKDKPNHLQIRLDTRPAHLEHLTALNESGKLKVSGPLLDDEGNPDGSLIVVEAADRAEAEKIAAADPYSKAGLFQNVEIRAWNWVFNNPANN